MVGGELMIRYCQYRHRQLVKLCIQLEATMALDHTTTHANEDAVRSLLFHATKAYGCCKLRPCIYSYACIFSVST